MSEIVFTHINTAPGVATSGNTVIATYSALIPANTFTIDKDVILEVQSRVVKTDTVTGVGTVRIYLNTFNSISGAFLIGNIAGTTASTFQFRQGRRFFRINSGIISFLRNSVQSSTDYINDTASDSPAVMTPTNNYYILIGIGYTAVSTGQLYGSFLKILAYQ